MSVYLLVFWFVANDLHLCLITWATQAVLCLAPCHLSLCFPASCSWLPEPAVNLFFCLCTSLWYRIYCCYSSVKRIWGLFCWGFYLVNDLGLDFSRVCFVLFLLWIVLLFLCLVILQWKREGFKLSSTHLVFLVLQCVWPSSPSPEKLPSPSPRVLSIQNTYGLVLLYLTLELSSVPSLHQSQSSKLLCCCEGWERDNSSACHQSSIDVLWWYWEHMAVNDTEHAAA